MEKEVILTPEGFEKLTQELDHLTNTRRKEVAERIKDSISFGDLSENSEYDDAKNEQAFLEGRIQQISDMLQKARVIEDAEISDGQVGVGSWVRLKDMTDNQTYEYHIVGSAEADPSASRISNESPVGEAIIGRAKGSVVMVSAPQGEFKYKVMDVRNNSQPSRSAKKKGKK